jgi:hypothetical protein
MKRTHVNFISMSLALEHFRQKYQEKILSDAVLTRLFDEFFGYFGEVQAAISIQEGHTSEAAKLKQKEEAEMIEATVRMAAKAYVYAVENNQPGLQEKLSVTAWNLRNMSDVKLHATCLSIHEALTGISSRSASVYGITPELLTGMKKEIDDFYALISQPRTEIITRSQATAKISEMIKKMKELLVKRLDKLMLALPESDVTMRNEYKATRIIIGMKGKKADEEEVQEDSPVQTPVK